MIWGITTKMSWLKTVIDPTTRHEIRKRLYVSFLSDGTNLAEDLAKSYWRGLIACFINHKLDVDEALLPVEQCTHNVVARRDTRTHVIKDVFAEESLTTDSLFYQKRPSSDVSLLRRFWQNSRKLSTIAERERQRSNCNHVHKVIRQWSQITRL